MNYFQQLRKAIGYSQEECAQELEISTSSVMKYEAEAPPHVIAQMEGWVDMFGVKFDKTIGGKKR